MAIKVGDRLPEGTLTELIEHEAPGCTIGPNTFNLSELTKGKRVVIFGLPGAFTPTCSAKHVPGYIANHDQLRAKGVDEVWCLAVNDAFVMGAWGKDAAGRGQGPHDGRRQRDLYQSPRTGPGFDRAWHGCPLAALLHARRGRHRQDD